MEIIVLVDYVTVILTEGSHVANAGNNITRAITSTTTPKNGQTPLTPSEKGMLAILEVIKSSSATGGVKPPIWVIITITTPICKGSILNAVPTYTMVGIITTITAKPSSNMVSNSIMPAKMANIPKELSDTPYTAISTVSLKFNELNY